MHTIKDVAAEAGVSIATVSNYINNTKPVSARTEKKIKDAIDRLNYTPNLSARNLKSNNYNDVGVILPNLNDSYYSQIFQGIELAFQASKYFLNLSFSYDIADIERNLVQGFLKKNVCGLILVTCQPDDWRFYYDRFTSQDKPLVLIDRLINDLDSIFLTFDNRSATCQLTASLIESGKKNIYLFSGPESFYCERDCILGYKEAMADHALFPDERHIITSSLNKEDAFRQIIKVLKSDRPDAIITTSELGAMGIIEGLTLLGCRSGDIPVIALGEEHWNRYTHSFASLSTVRPAMQMGEKAAELLMNQIHSPRTFEKQHIVLSARPMENDLSDISVSKRRPPKKEIQGEINVLMLETPQVDAMRGILPNFENETGIRVNSEILPHRYVFDRIMQEHSDPDSVKQSDVYMFDIPWLYYLVSSNILADITGYISDPSFHPDIYLPNSLKYFSEVEGRYYGLPFMYAPQIFYYRKDLFDNRALQTEYESRYHSKLRPPLTWTEFNAISEFFSCCDLPENLIRFGTSIPTAYKECLVPEIYMRLWAYGGKVFDRHNAVTFDSPQTLKAYVNYKSTLKSAKPDYKTATDVSVVSDFINGETAMLITYPSFLTDIVDLRRSSLTGSIGYSHIPGRTPILGGWSFGINSRSPKADAAFEFLKWTSTDTNANYFTLLGGQPAVTSIFSNDELIKLYPWLPLYHSAYKYTKPVVPPHQKGKPIISQDKIDSIIYHWTTELIDDHIDVTETIQRTQADLEALFRDCGY